MQHQTSTDDTADESTQVTNQCSGYQIFACGGFDADHKGGDNQTHAESSTQVGQSGELIFLEVAAELTIISEGENRGVIGQVGGDDAERSSTGQTEQGLHQRRNELVDQIDDTELTEQGGDSTGQNSDCHDIENRIHQKCIGGVHHGAEHIGGTHLASDQTENAEEYDQKDNWFDRTFVFGGHNRCSFQHVLFLSCRSIYIKRAGILYYIGEVFVKYKNSNSAKIR